MDNIKFEIEDTPNPNALKFIADRVLNTGPTRSYLSASQASDDPLATSLFSLPDVTSVMIVRDFVTVNKASGARWSRLKPKVIAVLQREFQADAADPEG